MSGMQAKFSWGEELRQFSFPVINIKPCYCDYCGQRLAAGFTHRHRGDSVEMLSAEQWWEIHFRLELLRALRKRVRHEG